MDTFRLSALADCRQAETTATARPSSLASLCASLPMLTIFVDLRLLWRWHFLRLLYLRCRHALHRQRRELLLCLRCRHALQRQRRELQLAVVLPVKLLTWFLVRVVANALLFCVVSLAHRTVFRTCERFRTPPLRAFRSILSGVIAFGLSPIRVQLSGDFGNSFIQICVLMVWQVSRKISEFPGYFNRLQQGR